jgi:hypothetical protein
MTGALKVPFGLLCYAVLVATAGGAVSPIRALLVTGGCCHDYSHQKDILKSGVEARANVTIQQVHTDDSSTHPPLAIRGNPDYAKGYDLVIHDECAADVSDPIEIKAVLKPHAEGIPGVNLHCAMHSYRVGNPNEPAAFETSHGLWFEYLGLQSSAHGPQEPIAVHYLDAKAGVTKGLGDWTTIKEELYNNVRVFDIAKPLARGTQIFGRNGNQTTNDFVVVWTSHYGAKKTRVFSTTLGHNTETVADSRYLDLVTRGILWATGHLKDNGMPEEGYARSSR